jgi:hypothetical protein
MKITLMLHISEEEKQETEREKKEERKNKKSGRPLSDDRSMASRACLLSTAAPSATALASFDCSSLDAREPARGKRSSSSRGRTASQVTPLDRFEESDEDEEAVEEEEKSRSSVSKKYA